MSLFLQTGLGILVSIVLFLIGYRQTIGARKERAKSADAALKRALLRRVVLEEYCPRPSDLLRLIEGKSQEFQVRAGDLLTPDELLSAVFAEVFDSDLVTAEQRTSVESRISVAVRELESRDDLPAPEEAVEDAADRTQKRVAALGLSTALVGTGAVLVSQLLKGGLTDFRLILPVLATLAGALAVNIAIAALRRTRDTGEPSTLRISSFTLRMDRLESEVANLLQKAGVKYEAQAPVSDLSRADFVFELGGKKIILETKAWKNVPLPYVARSVDRVRRLKESARASEAIIVVYDAKAIPRSFKAGDIPIMSVAELSAYLKSRK
jgi:hypothetical protein